VAHDELNTIGAAEALQIASQRPLHPASLLCDDLGRPRRHDLYVRNAHGSTNPWYRYATAVCRRLHPHRPWNATLGRTGDAVVLRAATPEDHELRLPRRAYWDGY
jgi:hypothetical protein